MPKRYDSRFAPFRNPPTTMVFSQKVAGGAWTLATLLHNARVCVRGSHRREDSQTGLSWRAPLLRSNVDGERNAVGPSWYILVRVRHPSEYVYGTVEYPGAGDCAQSDRHEIDVHAALRWDPPKLWVGASQAASL